MVRGRAILPLLAVLALAGCGKSSDAELKVAFIEDSAAGFFADGARLSPGAQHLHAATGAGLVTLDANGEVVPALADRWIVTDDGRSVIFRLRDGDWPGGAPLTADSARAALARAIARLDGTSLGRDLVAIAEVRAMAGRVIEIRLKDPFPALLQVLAQPEMELRNGAGAAGPMTLERRGASAVLAMKPPNDRGLPEEREWRAFVRPVQVVPVGAARAIALFDDNAVDVVLGGRVDSLPLADTGPLSRGTVRVDPAVGLFGLQVRRAEGFLAERERREALAMALDRAELLAPFNIGGWTSTSRVVAPGLPGDPGYVAERWSGRALAQLRAEATRRVAAWRVAAGGQPVIVTLALDRSTGTDRLFDGLAGQWATIGVTLRRVPEGAAADLVLVDRVARYAAPRWFLGQFTCAAQAGLCSADADFLLGQAIAEPDAARRATLFAEAELQLALANTYIPIGAPLRWSLVRSNVDGFAANSWAFHPLQAMAIIPR